MSEYLNKFFDVINLSPRHLFGISLLGLFLLFSPEYILDIFGVKELVSDYRSYTGIFTLFSILFFFIQLVPSIKSFIFQLKYKRRLLRELTSLSKEERVLLLYCVENNQKTISLSISHSVGNRLKSKGILERDSGSGNIMAWAYNINDVIWKEIQQNRSVLVEGLNEEQIRRIVNQLFDRLYN